MIKQRRIVCERCAATSLEPAARRLNEISGNTPLAIIAGQASGGPKVRVRI